MENETFFGDGHTKGARELAESFFAEHRIQDRKIIRSHFPLIEQHFNQCIVVYDVDEEGRFSTTSFSKNLVVMETSYQMLVTFM